MSDNQNQAMNSGESDEFVTVTIADQLFGIPVLVVQDILGPQKITKIPLAPAEVGGALNLRGRIVTAIDVRRRLGLAEKDDDRECMSVVVEHGGELYSLVVDAVGEVLGMSADTYESNPPTLDPIWREVSGGIYRLNGELMIVLEVDNLLSLKSLAA